MQPILMMAPAAGLLAGIGILLLVLKLFRARRAANARRPPQEEGTPLPPGRATLGRIEELEREVAALTIAAFALPVLVCTVVLVPLGTGRPEFNLFSVGVAAVAGAGICAFSLVRLLRLMRQRREARLEYDGKTAVGQALSGLAQDGYRIFHDVPGGDFSIDHVVVGESGVFAVEVKTRSKPGGSGRVEDATVAYNGHVLFFPRATDEETVARAGRKADWLSEWLESATGEEVAARALVVVPGWFVKRTTSDGIPVVSPRQLPSLFKFIVPRPLDAGQVARIAGELGQVCRAADPAPQEPGPALAGGEAAPADLEA